MTPSTPACPACDQPCRAISVTCATVDQLTLLTCSPCDRTTWTTASAPYFAFRPCV